MSKKEQNTLWIKKYNAVAKSKNENIRKSNDSKYKKVGSQNSINQVFWEELEKQE